MYHYSRKPLEEILANGGRAEDQEPMKKLSQLELSSRYDDLMVGSIYNELEIYQLRLTVL